MTLRFSAVSLRVEMRIGLISDSHIPEVASILPPQIKELFEGVDLILHAGDIYRVAVLDELERLAPVLAARGDDDNYIEVGDDRRVREKHVLKIEGVSLSLTHLMVSPRLAGLEQRTAPVKEWCGEVTDILVFGHLHRPVVECAEGVLLVNPGSPTFPEYNLKLGTVGLLTVTSGRAEVHIVQLY